MVSAQRLEREIANGRGGELPGQLLPEPGPAERLSQDIFVRLHAHPSLDVVLRRSPGPGWKVLRAVRREMQAELEKLCHSCKSAGLDDASTHKILSGTRAILDRARKPLTNSAVLHEFNPLNVVVMEQGVGFSDFSRLHESGSSYTDPATFLACVEALEKYPFCNRAITTEVQDKFLEAYGATEQERELLQVVKMKVLLSMFAAGRTVKESALRKKVMWANVMKKFIQAVAERSMPSAA